MHHAINSKTPGVNRTIKDKFICIVDKAIAFVSKDYENQRTPIANARMRSDANNRLTVEIYKPNYLKQLPKELLVEILNLTGVENFPKLSSLNKEFNLLMKTELFSAQLIPYQLEQYNKNVYAHKMERDKKGLEEVQLFLKDLNGNYYTFSCKLTMSIAHFRKMVAEKLTLYPDQCLLVYAGNRLEDEKTFNDYNILRECNITLILKMRGD